jgi:hypothetical protein
MKYLIILALSVMTINAHARFKVGQAGCGLGNQLLGDEPGVIQIVAATSNGFYGNQTSGITSGTSNCLDDSGYATVEAFVEANQVALSNEVSRGEGETVATLGKMLSCTNQEAVNASLKSSYGDIFENQEANTVSTEIRKVLKNTPKAGCKNLG